MGCATTSVKISSIVFNVLLAILGVVFIVYVATNSAKFSGNESLAWYCSCVLILVFATLGCYAAIRESVCLTATCAVFLLLLAITQIAFFVVYWNLSAGGHNGIETVAIAWRDNKMDRLQTEHQCCGKASAQDYILVSKPIPVTCYAEGDITHPEAFFVDGCSRKLEDYYETAHLRWLVIFIAVVVFEIVGFFLAVFLVINFRNKQRRLQF